MGSSLKIASVFGIAVRIHVSFLIYLAFICFSSYQEAGVEGAIQGGLLVLTLFAFVLLHEFGHAFAARTFGIRTPDITLYVIGGVARLNRIPDKPWQELIVAVAGPLVNVVIFFVLLRSHSPRNPGSGPGKSRRSNCWPEWQTTIGCCWCLT